MVEAAEFRSQRWYRPRLRGPRPLLVFLCLSLSEATLCAQTASIQEATSDQRRAAQKTLEAGDDLYEGGRFAQALTAFRASHELGKSPDSQLMVARCLRELGQLAEAHPEFVLALSEAEASGGRYAETVAAARAELEALSQRIALVLVEVEPGNELSEFRLGDRRFSNESLGQPIAVDAGELVITSRLNGVEVGTTLTTEPGKAVRVVLAPAAKHSVTAAERRPSRFPAGMPSSHSSLRAAAYVSAAVGAAGTVGFFIFGALNNARSSELDKSCVDSRCAPERKQDIEAGRRLQTLANVSLAAGVLGLASGVTLYLITPNRQEPSSLTAAVGPGSIKLEARF